jgi:hypothetical protein
MRTFSRQALHAAAPLGVSAFWCGLWIAAELYPSEYDWRYMTISSLLYPDRNPGGYRWAWSGVALCGVGGLCWLAALLCTGKHANATKWPIGIWAMALGYLCMICCALFPARFLHISRSHDMFALAAFIGVCIGTVCLTYCAVDQSSRLRVRALPGAAGIYACAIAGAALLPILLVGITQAYVSRELPQLPWVGLEWRAQGVPEYLSFAFWEWVTCAVFSVYTSTLAVLELRG